MNTNYKAIQALWKTIPKFKCKEGCYDCCEMITMTRVEWENIEPKLCAAVSNEKGQVLASLLCPYINDGRCSIYENRPTICRLFGAVETPRLTCPHGCGPDPESKLHHVDSLAMLSALEELGGTKND